MNEEICQCGHPKNTHMPFEKPAFGITHICGVNLCDCEQFRPTPLALDAATAAAQQEEIKTNLRNCKCVVVETPRQ